MPGRHQPGIRAGATEARALRSTLPKTSSVVYTERMGNGEHRYDEFTITVRDARTDRTRRVVAHAASEREACQAVTLSGREYIAHVRHEND